LRVILSFLLCFFFTAGYAAEELEPLPADEAFQITAAAGSDAKILINWKIAPDYYIYKDKIRVSPGPTNQVKFTTLPLPKGSLKKDSRGEHQVYFKSLDVQLQLNESSDEVLDIVVCYQGCSQNGFCYAPTSRSILVDLKDLQIKTKDLTPYIAETPSVYSGGALEQDKVQKVLNDHDVVWVILTFLGLGVLLAFTPCVLPMVPILSGIIMGHRKKKLTTTKTFLLSLSYVLGMATTYAIAGIVVANLGGMIQAELQRPWVIVIFSAIFVLLALSLFDCYQLRLPNKLQQVITNISNEQKAGTYLGVFLMGGISSLIVSPCITPPLVGVLAYIAQTGDSFLGAIALFMLGLGMGVPLLLIGASAGSLLPKAGPWMVALERLMGVMMLGLAIWILSRILPGSVTLFLWSILLMGTAVYMGLFKKPVVNKSWVVRSTSLVLFIYGVILLVGAAQGNSDPLNPWQNLRTTQNSAAAFENEFKTLDSMQQFDRLLARAKQDGMPVLVDFYADWCESCILMERYVLSRPDVKAILAEFVLLKADVTKNNAFDKALMKRLGVIAPPTWVFFDENGKDLSSKKLVGEVSANKFISHLSNVLKEGATSANS